MLLSTQSSAYSVWRYGPWGVYKSLCIVVYWLYVIAIINIVIILRSSCISVHNGRSVEMNWPQDITRHTSGYRAIEATVAIVYPQGSITPRACTRGKVMGSSCVVVHTKIARSRHLGVLVSEWPALSWYQKTSKFSFQSTSLIRAWMLQIVLLVWPCLLTIPKSAMELCATVFSRY